MRIKPLDICVVVLLWSVSACSGNGDPAADAGSSDGAPGTTDGATTDGGPTGGNGDSGGTGSSGGTGGSDGSSDGETATTTADGGSDTTAGGSPEVGFGILGDSNSDEYRADDNRGGAYAAVTFNWMEQLVMFRGLDFGPWGRWGGPRRSGYEYNWARSGARAVDLVGQGQADGVAQQVTEGQVDYVYLEIGANDFHLVNGTYLEIYDGSLSDPQVAAKVTQVVDDIGQAVDIVLEAEPAALFLRTLGDPGLAPGTALMFPDADGRARVSAAIVEVNTALEELATSRPALVIIDTNLLATSLLDQVDGNGMLMVGDELIDLVEPGNEPHHGRLGDSSGHSGTVLSGLIANLLFIEPINEATGFDISPFTDDEILSHAGL